MTTRSPQWTVGDYLLDTGVTGVDRKGRNGAWFVRITLATCSGLVRSVGPCNGPWWVVECTAMDQERSARDLLTLVSGPTSTALLLVSAGGGETPALARGAG